MLTTSISIASSGPFEPLKLLELFKPLTNIPLPLQHEKNLLNIFSTLVLVSCAQKPSSQKLVLNPPAILYYNLVLDSKILKLNIDLECKIEKENGKIIVNSEIKKIIYTDGSSDEAAINKDYQSHVGGQFVSEFDSLGHQINEPDSRAFVNISLLFAEFSPVAIKSGDTWSGKKPAKPDMIFDHMITNYTCESINDSSTTIKTVMNFKQAGDKSSQMNITKKYEGNYVVDNATGSVISGNFTLTGFSGFSNMKGEVIIKRL